MDEITIWRKVEYLLDNNLLSYKDTKFLADLYDKYCQAFFAKNLSDEIMSCFDEAHTNLTRYIVEKYDKPS